MSGARLDGTCCCTAPQLLPSQALLPQPLMFLSWRVCCCAWWNAGPSCRCPSHSRRSEVVKLDSAFPRNSGVKEESTSLNTSSPFPSRPTRKKPSAVGTLLSPTQAPLVKASAGSAGPLSPSRTLPHVRSAPSATVENEKPDTARRASCDSTISGQINRIVVPLNAGQSQLSSSRTG